MKHLLLPIETISRELDGRLLLASAYATPDHRVFMGTPLLLRRILPELRGGLYLGKHAFYPHFSNSPDYRLIKAQGFTVLQLSEEGGVFMGLENDWRADLDFQLEPKYVEPDDYICTWGDFQRDHYLAKSPKNPDHVRTTGHPRFELCKPRYRALYDDDVADIRARFGSFVLLNSNFSLALDPEGPHNTFSDWLGYTPNDDESRMRFLARWSRSVRTVPEFIELLHHLAVRKRDVNIVIRPHPSDNLEFFRAAFNGIKNVHVVRDGNVAPWILASRVMLHDGCTTALEARLFARRIVNFAPIIDDETDHYLPNLFGKRVSTRAEALDALLDALDQTSDLPEPSADDVPALAKSVFMSFEHDALEANMAVMREAEANLARTPSSTATTSLARVVAEDMRERAIEGAKHLARRAFFRRRYLTAMHGRQRYPGMEKAYLEKRLKRLGELTKNPLEIAYFSPNVVELRTAR